MKHTKTFNKIYDILSDESEMTCNELKIISNICYGKGIILKSKEDIMED